MNNAALIAILVIKDVVSADEGERLVEFFNNKPQPTQLADAIDQIKAIFDSLKSETEVEREQIDHAIAAVSHDTKQPARKK